MDGKCVSPPSFADYSWVQDVVKIVHDKRLGGRVTLDQGHGIHAGKRPRQNRLYHRCLQHPSVVRRESIACRVNFLPLAKAGHKHGTLRRHIHDPLGIGESAPEPEVLEVEGPVFGSPEQDCDRSGPVDGLLEHGSHDCIGLGMGWGGIGRKPGGFAGDQDQGIVG